MTAKKIILCAVGTRPEAVKMAPVIAALRAAPWAEVRVLATAQHRELLDQALAVFGIAADLDLNLMTPNQSLSNLTARLMTELDRTLLEEKPATVLAQGDTTTVFCSALASFYHNVPFGHVEAGLRTFRKRYPFPEEMNRLLASRLADIHFAPTNSARDNLLSEGIDPGTVHMTGNTVIDALLIVAKRDLPPPVPLAAGQRLLLVTAHRRENFGAPFEEVCLGIRDLAERHRDAVVVYPVHPNPNVQSTAHSILGQRDRIHLLDPLDYPAMVGAMKHATLIVTDSGGLQEEAPALGKPVLVLRDETERPEAVASGAVKLVGPHRDRIVAEASRLLDDKAAYAAMARPVFPYGDGNAAGRIEGALRIFLGAG